MRPKRFFLIITGVLILLSFLIIGASIGGNILLKKQSSKLAGLKLQSRVLDEQQTLLNRAKKDIAKYSELGNITKSIVPQDKDQAKTVRTLNIIAGQSNIQLNTITFASSNLGLLMPATPAPTGGTVATPKPSPTLTQVKPLAGIPGVYSLEITIGSDPDAPVPYTKFVEFLEKLEASRRTAHVTKVVITPTKDGSKLSFTLTLNAYIKP